MIDSISGVSAFSKSMGLDSLTTELSTFDLSTQGVATAGLTPGMSTGETFLSTLNSMATEAVGNLKQAEQTSFDGITGKANTREVVDAVMSAEQSLQTAIAFRDKIVSAYLEITKMQI
ncbi:flagellar hook-basal body complex protein FliE [Rhizobium sp. 18065]|uniref:flagellar hook-basal body complex protein FliE n=1 Tax=Rhizobium sp. 18065 TaxID=2681411 RepID=UPI001359050E|nr:flagellar hook-basal body complex protein FliE [Rhizobium sp. 18065]